MLCDPGDRIGVATFSNGVRVLVAIRDSIHCYNRGRRFTAGAWRGRSCRSRISDRQHDYFTDHRQPYSAYPRGVLNRQRRPRVAESRLDPRTKRIVARVRAIPVGFVRTYGDIEPKAPRLVGRVLATTQERLPWHRVVRADGSIPMGRRQSELLLREGVPMRGDRVDLRLARVPSSVQIR